MILKASNPTIAVVMHLTNEDYWPQISMGLKLLPNNIQLFISSCIDKPLSTKTQIQEEFPNVRFFQFINKGGNIGSLISLLKLIRLDEFDLVLKIHTEESKKYAEAFNDEWFKELISGLLPKGRVNLIFDFFDRNPSIGIAGPNNFLWPFKKLLYNDKTIDLWNSFTLKRNSSDFPIVNSFFAGAMFWARGKIFNELLKLNLEVEQFDNYSGELNGNLEDVIERYFTLMAHDINLSIGSFDYSDFSFWASNRKINETQRSKFQDLFENYQKIPRIHILVRANSEKSNERLNLTLNSIRNSQFSNLPISVEITIENNSCFVASINEKIIRNDFDWLLILNEGDEITSTCLPILVSEIIKKSQLNIIYTDKLIRSQGGSIETALLPDFNFDLAVSFPWLLSNHFLFKCEILNALDGFDEQASEFFELDFILKFSRIFKKSKIHHLAEPLIITDEPEASIHSNNELRVVEKHVKLLDYSNSEVLSLSPRVYRVNYIHNHNPKISIIIAHINIQKIQLCIESILSNTSYTNFEILIVDNDSKDPETVAWLKGISEIDVSRFRIITNLGSKDIASMNNLGAKEASGTYLLFFSSYVKCVEPSWLHAMLKHAQRREVGVVGAKIIDINFNIIHAGYILGMSKGKESAFQGEPFDSIGHLQRLRVDQSYSAVSTYCSMLDKDLFIASGGFDNSLSHGFFLDMDFCLKVKNLGYENIWTPHSIVQIPIEFNDDFHNLFSVENLKFLDASEKQIFNRWLPHIANDPSYNKNLSVVADAFSVDPDINLTWQPITWRPDPVVLAHPSDDTGCGQYRVIKPLKSMIECGLADGAVSFRHLLPSELERIKPDSIIFQRPLDREMLRYMKHSKLYSNAFKVYEIDDLITNIPLKNHYRSLHPKDTFKLLREGISQVDRLVVSTPGLADAYANLHSDIKILELKLPPIWWSNLNIIKTDHKKPRVGWAGGSSHLGDLELIADVVKDLADEVDWIFFGMCPSKLMPYVKEFHSGVPIHLYPQKLASLDLDLAVAPLENNQFNDCKSNLRILEYGACGYATICSNTRAYSESKLPVTLVKNKYIDWTNAIRMHINSLNETKIMGEILYKEIQSNWFLNDLQIKNFISAWSK